MFLYMEVLEFVDNNNLEILTLMCVDSSFIFHTKNNKFNIGENYAQLYL